MKIAITVIAAVAGAATAAPYFTVNNDFEGVGVQTPANATATLTIDISGQTTSGAIFGGLNTVLMESLGAGTAIIGFSWTNVEITTEGGSWLSEARIAIYNTDVTGAVGFAFSATGAPGNESGLSGSVDLVASGFDFFLNADGILNIEFYESYVDPGLDPQALFKDGQIMIQYKVPAPGALAMLGLGGLVAGRRRR